MCYVLLLSTDSNTDLSRSDEALISFARELPAQAESSSLEFAHVWFVGSRSGCSCGFRHLYKDSVELGFGEPVAWYPEEPEDIEATVRFIALVRTLVARGARVDCIDLWNHNGAPARVVETIRIPVMEMNDRAFRFFEGRRFVFSAGTTSTPATLDHHSAA